MVFDFDLREALRGQHVFDFAGADAEGQRAERAVRGGVAVAADDGLSRLRDAEFGADDVHDALIAAEHIEETDAGFRQLRSRASNWPRASASRIGRSRFLVETE